MLGYPKTKNFTGLAHYFFLMDPNSHEKMSYSRLASSFGEFFWDSEENVAFLNLINAAK